ncbi:MAG: hypothetical protein DRJ09_11965 [Bacteroidetes bacterium]|nr:MAG: hypothetical protein DRJ09_11965 [Bacteroidota bacterium]
MKQYINGIFNYCDRWCERCPLASECGNYAPYFTGGGEELLKRDEKNRQFWSSVDGRASEALAFTQKMAKEQGVDVSDVEVIDTRKKFDLFQGEAKTNEVLRVGRKYEDQVDDWFDEAGEKYPLRAEDIAVSELKLAPDAPFDNIDEINNMIEVVFRYQLQIYLKLSRAFFSKGKEELGEQEGEDSNGAAKLIVEFIDRSLVGWYVFYNSFTEEQTSIFPIMFTLLSIRNRLLKEFPSAMEFKRAGFDTGRG